MSDPIPPEPPTPDPFAAATLRARSRIRATHDHRPFSEQGFDTLEESISDYIASLVQESTRIARTEGADVISASDVQRASRYLFRAPVRSLVQQVGTIGGVLFGAALSNALALIGSKHPSGSGIGVTVGLAVVGTAMIVFHIARESK